MTVSEYETILLRAAKAYCDRLIFNDARSELDDPAAWASIFCMSSSQIAINSAFSRVLACTMLSRLTARSSALCSLALVADSSASRVVLRR